MPLPEDDTLSQKNKTSLEACFCLLLQTQKKHAIAGQVYNLTILFSIAKI
jgi:hypothetical protein